MQASSCLAALGVWGLGWGPSYQARMFWWLLLAMLCLHFIRIANQIPSLQHGLLTAQPYFPQMMTRIASSGLGSLVSSLLVALQISFAFTIGTHSITF